MFGRVQIIRSSYFMFLIIAYEEKVRGPLFVGKAQNFLLNMGNLMA